MKNAKAQASRWNHRIRIARDGPQKCILKKWNKIKKKKTIKTHPLMCNKEQDATVLVDQEVTK